MAARAYTIMPRSAIESVRARHWKLQWVRRNQRNRPALLGRNIFGELQVYRTGTLLLRHSESFTHQGRDHQGGDDLTMKVW